MAMESAKAPLDEPEYAQSGHGCRAEPDNRFVSSWFATGDPPQEWPEQTDDEELPEFNTHIEAEQRGGSPTRR